MRTGAGAATSCTSTGDYGNHLGHWGGLMAEDEDVDLRGLLASFAAKAA